MVSSPDSPKCWCFLEICGTGGRGRLYLAFWLYWIKDFSPLSEEWWFHHDLTCPSFPARKTNKTSQFLNKVQTSWMLIKGQRVHGWNRKDSVKCHQKLLWSLVSFFLPLIWSPFIVPSVFTWQQQMKFGARSCQGHLVLNALPRWAAATAVLHQQSQVVPKGI